MNERRNKWFWTHFPTCIRNQCGLQCRTMSPLLWEFVIFGQVKEREHPTSPPCCFLLLFFLHLKGPESGRERDGGCTYKTPGPDEEWPPPHWGRVRSQSCCSLLWEVHYKSLVSYPPGLPISPALLGNKKIAWERRRKDVKERDGGGYKNI